MQALRPLPPAALESALQCAERSTRMLMLSVYRVRTLHLTLRSVRCILYVKRLVITSN